METINKEKKYEIFENPKIYFETIGRYLARYA